LGPTARLVPSVTLCAQTTVVKEQGRRFGLGNQPNT